jgi:hypothetical protein
VTVAAPLVQVVRATADTWVSASATTRNYGGSAALGTRGSPTAIAYLKFVVPNAPVGHALSTVVLTFRTTGSAGSGTKAVQYFRATSDGWNETSVTYTNRPGSSGTLLGSLGSAPSLNTSYRVALSTSALMASKSAAGRVNLAMVAAGVDPLSISSAQSAIAGSQPTLTFTWK